MSGDVGLLIGEDGEVSGDVGLYLILVGAVLLALLFAHTVDNMKFDDPRYRDRSTWEPVERETPPPAVPQSFWEGPEFSAEMQAVRERMDREARDWRRKEQAREREARIEEIAEGVRRALLGFPRQLPLPIPDRDPGMTPPDVVISNDGIHFRNTRP